MPNLVQTMMFAHRPVEFLLHSQQRHGDAFRMRLLKGQNCVIFSQPKAIEEIFSDERGILKGGQAYQKLMSFLHSESLLHLDDADHRTRKKQVAPALAGSLAQTYAQQAHDVTAQVVENWPRQSPFAIDAAIDHLSLEVTLRLVFGTENQAAICQIGQQFLQSIRPYNNRAWLLLGVMLESSNKGMLASQRRRLMNAMIQEIQNRRQGCADSSTCVLDQLIAQNVPLADCTDEALCGDLLTIMLGFYFGISGTLKRTLCLLVQSNRAQQSLAAELRTTDYSGDAAALNQFPYLDAVVKESLRLCPSLPFALRQVTETHSINGHRVQAGEMVAACMTLTHRLPEIYDRPQVFNPQRFLDRSYSIHEYYPFGGGLRMCAARQLAPLLFKAVLAPVVQQGLFETLDRGPMPMTLKGIFMMPARKLVMRITSPPAKPQHTKRELESIVRARQCL